jgi:hypothetical protein
MSRYRYCSTAYLFRELAYLKAKREDLEDFCASILGKTFDYHARRKEILNVLVERSARRTRKAA